MIVTPLLWTFVLLINAVISSPTPTKVIKRYSLSLTGFNNAESRNEFNDDIDTVISMAQLVVNNIRANHAIYLRYFGSPDNYDDVMAVYQRIANLRNTNNDQTIEFTLTGLPGAQVTDLATNQVTVQQATYTGPNHAVIGDHPRIRLYNEYRSANFPGDLNFVYLQNTAPGVLDQARRTRQGVLFHEVS